MTCEAKMAIADTVLGYFSPKKVLQMAR